MVCWSEGGTRMAIRFAEHYRIPVLNLAGMDVREAMDRLDRSGQFAADGFVTRHEPMDDCRASCNGVDSATWRLASRRMDSWAWYSVLATPLSTLPVEQ